MENAPLEEVMSELFARDAARRARGRPEAVRMSLRSTLRALPTLMRVGFAEAVAYRAEMLVWVLSTTMPLDHAGAVDGGGARTRRWAASARRSFTAYFLATFIVRAAHRSWAAWQINFEVRAGHAGACGCCGPISPARRLRGGEPGGAAACASWSPLPVAVDRRCSSAGREPLPQRPGGLGSLLLVALLGGWLITFLANVAIGTLALSWRAA